MGNLVLGLDLGPNSIGWALIDDNKDDPSKSKIVDLGVRVFPEGVDAFDTSKEVSRSEQRRIARGMRRQQRRRANRRRKLKNALVDLNLWPTDDAEQQRLLNLDPYELRTKALDQQLSLHEIGRVFLHINQRRGFRSNKKEQAKADAKAKKKSPEADKPKAPAAEKKTEDILLEMAELEKAIRDSGARTLGEYLFRKVQKIDHRVRADDDIVRGRHTQRKMLIEEFDKIWAKQAAFHPQLSEALRDGKIGRLKDIHKPIPKDREFLDGQQTVKNLRYGLTDLQAFGVFGLIFFHRSLKPVPKEIVGLCELEPKARRCAKSDRRAQRFRLLQEINNLRYIDPDLREECSLADGQRAILLEHLATREKMTFDDIRKKLGFLESVKFKNEDGNRSSIQGAVTDWLIAKAYGKDWHELPEDLKDNTVNCLVSSIDEDEARQHLINKFGFEDIQADALLGVELPEGYVRLSLIAIEKLLPHLKLGLMYMATDSENSALHAAGYLRRDQLKRRIFDKLPDPRRTADSPIGDIPNPVVKRTLTEIRKVVNAIVREYGKPEAVHLEMARSLQMSAERRKKYNKQIRDREADRSKIAEELRANNVRPTRENILRYDLWMQQNKECIYSYPSKPISFSQLFSDSGGVDVDHILPYKRTLDGSQLNKVVCFRRENGDKKDRTPYEWLAAGDPKKYEEICQRAKKLPYSKYRKFLQKELELDSFIARQLTDTAYITKATSEYLKCLFDKEHSVLGLKGQLTGELRWHWGLETVIEELPDSPAWDEANDLRPGEKNRADHRHHAIDAVVLALTNRSRLQQLSRIVRAGGARKNGEVLLVPWENFREDVKQRIAKVNVSHRVERKVTGALHDDQPFGSVSEGEGKQLRDTWVKRKPISALSVNEVEKIRDETIKQLVISSLVNAGVPLGRGTKLSKQEEKKMETVLANIKMVSGVPVKKVRLLVPDQTIRRIRNDKSVAHVKPGSIHHFCIFEWKEKGRIKRDAVFVSMLDAMDRLKRMEPIVQRFPPEGHETIPSDAKFVNSLSSGELMALQIDGKTRIARMRTSVSTEKKMTFSLIEDSRRGYRKINANINTIFSTYHARKVTVDPLGRIRWAND